QHGLSHRVSCVDAARRVGEHDRPAPGRDRGPYPVHDRVRVMPLIKMNPAEVYEHPPLAFVDIRSGGCVPFYGRLLKVAEFREGYFEFSLTDGIGGGPPARPEHDD